MTTTRAVARLLAGGLVMATTAMALGHNGATGIVAERMMGMMMLAEQVKLLAPLAERGLPPEPSILVEAAGMIQMHSGSAMTDLFPEGSLDAPSVARTEIWTRWEEFAAYSERLMQLGRELQGLAENRPATEMKPVAEPQSVVSTLAAEWGRMSYASLMGLADPKPAYGIDTLVTGAIGEDIAEPVEDRRSLKAVVSDITATCSSCHAAFRR